MRLENKSLYFTFGIDDVNVIEDDDRFAITKIRAFAEKENSHTQPISFDSLKMTANTIYNVATDTYINKSLIRVDGGYNG